MIMLNVRKASNFGDFEAVFVICIKVHDLTESVGDQQRRFRTDLLEIHSARRQSLRGGWRGVAHGIIRSIRYP